MRGLILMAIVVAMMFSCNQEQRENGDAEKLNRQVEQQKNGKKEAFLKEMDRAKSVAPQKITQDRTKYATTGGRVMELANVRRKTIQVPKIIRGGSSAPYHSSVSTKNYRAPRVLKSPITPVVNQSQTREKYEKHSENGLKEVKKSPLSTFSIDVDTASYALMRSMINNRNINRDGIRVEEMINYFSYEYPQPKKEMPFSVTTQLYPSILNKDRHMIQIGIQGKRITSEKRKAANFVFLIDTSGSMNNYNKLPLLKKAFHLMLKQLGKDDTISVVTYAGNSYVALEPTPGNEAAKIQRVIDALGAGGSTYGSGGIINAYKQAEKNFSKDKINRIILATDGDFNVGISNRDKMLELIKEKRKSGITITTLGFGRGNYNDAMMEKIADNGNGNYFYLDTIQEAKKVLVSELTANMEVIAKDVKIQVEFNPQQVSYYRLIGYENRMLKKEDFKNDKVDAGEIGSGHSVTALYEVILADSKNQPVGKLRYKKTAPKSDKVSNEVAFVKLRYKKPQGEKSILVTTPIKRDQIIASFDKVSRDARFATGVAAFGLYLKQSDSSKLKFNDILATIEAAKGHDEFGYRQEFIGLMKQYQKINK